MPKRVMEEKFYTKRRDRPKVRWLDDVHEDLRKDGEGKPKTETCGGEQHRRPRLTKGCTARW
jgi:hypothetical protein